MHSLELALLNQVDVWPFVLVIAGWTVLMCLKVLGHSHDNAIRRHNLRLEAHILLLHYQRQLGEQKRIQGGSVTGSAPLGNLVENEPIHPEVNPDSAGAEILDTGDTEQLARAA